MERRTVIAGLGAAFITSGVTSGIANGITAGGRPVFRRVRPSDAAWPGREQWEALKAAVGGNLAPVQGMFTVCDEPQSKACADLHKNLRNPFFLGDQAAGTQVSGWLDAWSPAPSVYAVKARSAADVAAAVNFARTHKLRLVVKGAGHSYQGTSNAADSLLIWTRGMTGVALHDAFIPEGCAGKAEPVQAVTVGAGAVWIDVYDAVTNRGGRYVQGGGCTDVGVAGLVQSGGFGSFSKGFGTAAASLLEVEIVTADGVIRTINACRDPDLFWAVKGGGGGSWGVVTKLTLRTHDLPAFLGGVGGRIAARSPAAYRDLIVRFLDFYAAALLNPQWGEQVHFRPDNVLEISMSQHGLDSQQTSAVWRPFIAWVEQRPNDYEIKCEAYALNARQYWDAGAMIHDDRDGAPKHHGWWRGDQDQVWAYLHGFDSLWLPAALLQRGNRRKLADALFAGSRHKRIDLHFNKGLAGASPDSLAASRITATNPAVLSAFALAIIADIEAGQLDPKASAIDVAAARGDAAAITAAASELRKIVPNAGSYVSESNYFNTAWQRAFWGTHYERLQKIKAQYDPEGLFFVHHGVGSEAWSTDGFERLG